MSGAVVRASSNFQQQGTVDWVELSGRSVNFSVAVLARLSKAGIDPFTLQVGRAICTNFSLDPIAQQRISEAIQALRNFRSYGDILWFGFGIKHVVTDLAETEQGLTLVALCAALSSTYHLLYGARVLRELCSLCKAPQAFSPAIRQWKILVELCSGILNSSHFALLLDGFRRLVQGGRNVSEDFKVKRYPTTCSILAEAIMTIAQLTTKRLASVTFTGGLDCIWLAAVAESIFSLDVIMYNSADVQVYRSRSLDQRPPQIKICYIEELTDSKGRNFVSEKMSLVPNGCTLFVRENGDSIGTLHPFNWPSSWSTILHDTFPGAIDILLTGEICYQFSLYLYCVSMMQTELRDGNEPSSTEGMYGFFNSNFVGSLRGHEFLSVACKRVPELSRCLEYDFSLVPQHHFYSASLAARSIIESEDDSGPPEGHDRVSLTVLTECITIFLCIILASDIDEEIAPSINGLRWLYLQSDGGIDEFMLRNSVDNVQEQTALVFRVLSRSGEPASSSNLLAMAGAGVCVYQQVLSDPHLSPDSILRTRVVPGYVSHAGAVFRTISSILPQANHPEFSFDALSTCQSVDVIVQETEQDSELGAAYQVNYINRQGEKKYMLLSLNALLYQLQILVRTFKCKGNCLELPTKALRDDGRSCNHERMSSWQKLTGRHWLALFDQAASDNAQRLIADSQHFRNLWVSTSEGGWRSSSDEFVDTKILIERPFMIYLSLMEDKRLHTRVFPLSPCLSCIIGRGVFGSLGPFAHYLTTGSVRLVGPGRAETEMLWEQWITHELVTCSLKEEEEQKKKGKNPPYKG